MFYGLSDYPASLFEYGINIPLSRDRYTKIIELIQENHWPLECITSGPCELTFLAMAYQEKILKSPDKVVEEAYELIDSSGQYHRYDPQSAVRPLRELLHYQLQHAYVTTYVAQKALENKKLFSFIIGAGMHHAHANGPSGFCIINDVAISALSLANKNANSNFWIIDVDAHRGDGTAAMAFQSSQIQTLSLHMQNSWPMNENKNEKPWHFVPSTCDIGLNINEENLYLAKLQSGLDFLAKNYSIPDLVYIVQGSDAYYLDELASTSDLNLSDEQILARDQLIFEFFYRKKIPQVYTMGGGYGAFSHRPYQQFLNWLQNNFPEAIHEI